MVLDGNVVQYLKFSSTISSTFLNREQFKNSLCKFNTNKFLRACQDAMNHNRPISRPLLLAVEAPCRAHSPAHFFTLAWISQQRSLQTMSSMPDVRAAASSLPWRNAQPTPPPVAVPPTTTTTPPPPSGHLHRIQDLVGYTAVLPLKAREKNLAKERVLGVVKEVSRKRKKKKPLY